jgi:hypothetical protein
MGGWGVGKSYAAVALAKYLRQTGSDAIVYVIDTTYEAERNFIDCGDNVVIHQVEEWDDYLKVVKEIREVSRSQDWLVVDRLDEVWEKAQAGYSEKVFGKEIDEWFIEYKRDHGEGHAFSGEYGTNWGIIKRMHAAFTTEVLRFKGNVLVTTTAEPVVEPNRDGKGGDDKDVRAEFGKFGVRPGGEKRNGFKFHTILLLAEARQGSWIYTTIRDRSREQQKGKKMTDFVVSYLVGVAGWKL